MEEKNNVLLDVRNLVTRFKLDDGILTAVDGVSFTVDKNQTVGIVGESGCGKSVTAFSVLRLVGAPGKVESGSIMFDGEDLLALSKGQMRKVRGNKISMIFQEPMTSLNPVYTCGEQIEEALRLHLGLKGEAISVCEYSTANLFMRKLLSYS